MSFIINSSDSLVAEITDNLKSGTTIIYSFNRTINVLNANRDFDLVNPVVAKISNAKKWEKCYGNSLVLSEKIAENEYFLTELN